MKKNVYIISEVLFDYTPGMAVIVAKDLDECRELFAKEFFEDNLKEFDDAIAKFNYKLIPTNEYQESRVVSYVYGGG